MFVVIAVAAVDDDADDDGYYYSVDYFVDEFLLILNHLIHQTNQIAGQKQKSEQIDVIGIEGEVLQKL